MVLRKVRDGEDVDDDKNSMKPKEPGGDQQIMVTFLQVHKEETFKFLPWN